MPKGSVDPSGFIRVYCRRLSTQLTVITPIGSYYRSGDLAVKVQCQPFDSLLTVKFGDPSRLVDAFGYLHQEPKWCFGL